MTHFLNLSFWCVLLDWKSIKSHNRRIWMAFYLHELLKHGWSGFFYFYKSNQRMSKKWYHDEHFPTCTVPVSGLYLFSHMYGSSLYLWIVCTSFPTCTVPSKYALPFFGTCTVKTPFNKQQFHKNQWPRNILMTNYVSKQIHRLSFK